MQNSDDKPTRPTAFIFPNGNLAVCGVDGQQIPEAQTPWMALIAQHLEQHGLDPANMTIMGYPHAGGREMRARLFRTSDGGWNWDWIKA